MKIVIVRFSCILLFIFIVFQGRAKSQINFNFMGRKVLYTDISKGKAELILYNLDTDKKLIFRNFRIDNYSTSLVENLEDNEFILFNNGKNILINPINFRGIIYIYDVLAKSKRKINLLSKNSILSEIRNINIINNKFYFSDDNIIYEYSLNNFDLVDKFIQDLTINCFSVYDEDLFAINYTHWGNDSLIDSNIYLKKFKDKSSREIPYEGTLYGWASHKKDLLFEHVGPILMAYPSCKINRINAIKDDSLNVFRNIFFVSDHELIFSACNKCISFFKKHFYFSTNLYLFNLKTNKIRQLTNSDSEKEIKSTCY